MGTTHLLVLRSDDIFMFEVNMIDWLTITILAIPLGCITFLLVSTLKSQKRSKPAEKSTFFLPNDFFISLVFLMNFWVILLILLGAQELGEKDQRILAMVFCLGAPFLSFWQKKRWERHI